MKRNSFTLIEILGVMVIITILATLGFAGYSYAQNKSRESATQGLITRLNAAFEFARQKTGFIPDSGDKFRTVLIDPMTASMIISNDSGDYFTMNTEKENGKLIVKVSRSGSSPKKYDLDSLQGKMYLNFYKHFTKTLEMDTMGRFMDGSKIVDAWGNPIYYRYPGVIKEGGFDLISAGSDGTFGSGEASTPPDSLDKYREGAEWICDDIANF